MRLPMQSVQSVNQVAMGDEHVDRSKTVPVSTQLGSLSPLAQQFVGGYLKDYFAETANAEYPDHFETLLKQLEAKELSGAG